MKVVETTLELEAALHAYRGKAGFIGFVPTMGALHPGHLSLLERAKLECIVTVVSIFVNPTQFNDPKDLEQYPRTLGEDLKMLEDAGCDLVFVPSVKEMYPRGVKSDALEIDFGILENVMEGKSRPGHFKGMATVVNLLFQKVKPHKAYFGKKDYQQLTIVKELVKRQNLPIEIVGCETMREFDGLAMSSRNKRLNLLQREKATCISKVLFETRGSAVKRTVAELQKTAKKQLEKEQLFALDYFEIVDRDTLQLLPAEMIPVNAVACVALKIGDIRLIDNIEL